MWNLEFVDIMLIFWTLLALAVYLLGNVFESMRTSRNKITSRTKQTECRDYNFTSSYGEGEASKSYTSPYGIQRDYYGPSGNHESTYQMPTTTTSTSTTATNLANKSTTTREHYDSEYLIGKDRVRPMVNRARATIVVPSATGIDVACVDWINSILSVLFTQFDRYVPVFAEGLCRSLNEKLANLEAFDDSKVSAVQQLKFRDIARAYSTRPQLTNVRTENESARSVTVTCKLYTERLVLDVTSEIRHEQQQQHVHELWLEQLEARVKCMAMIEDKLLIVQFMEKPEVQVSLRAKYNNDQLPDPAEMDTVIDIVMRTLSDVVVDLYFGDVDGFPIFRSASPSTSRNTTGSKSTGLFSETRRHIKQDFFGVLAGLASGSSGSHKQQKQQQQQSSILGTNLSSSTGPSSTSGAPMERKILVKVIRATGLRYPDQQAQVSSTGGVGFEWQDITMLRPVCFVELDEPAQRVHTSARCGSHPAWSEHFIMTLNERSNDLMFELRHCPSTNLDSTTHIEGEFLGMAIVSIEELRARPVQSQVLTLRGRPLEPPMRASHVVGGQLHVEFLFMEHSLSGAIIQAPASYNAPQNDGLVSVERKFTPSGYVITTTTVTKIDNNQHDDIDSKVSPFPTPLPSRSASASPSSVLPTDVDNNIANNINGTNVVDGQTIDGNAQRLTPATPGTPESERSPRAKQRSRSLLRAIKKRFSFSRPGRSTSQGNSQRRPIGSRSGSIDSMDASSIGDPADDELMAMTDGRARSVPPPTLEERRRHRHSAAQSATDTVPSIRVIGASVSAASLTANTGRRSSLGIGENRADNASAFTFTHPRSQLVIEMKDNTSGVLRHYALPNDISAKAAGKYLRRRSQGNSVAKIHVYNEHQFVARHLAASSACHVCGRVFTRRPGKQGYRCRNCDFVTHKQCHVKVDHECPHGARNAMIIDYIQDDEINKSARKNKILQARSVSMEVD